MADRAILRPRLAAALLLLAPALAPGAEAVYTCDLEGWSVVVLDDGRCNGAPCKNAVAVLASDSCNGSGQGASSAQEAGP